MINTEDLHKIKKLLKNVKIHIIPYCHADYAWTHPRKWHIKRYNQIISEVLDIMNSNPNYIWMADNIYPMLQPCLSEENERANEFWQRVKEGRIEITNGIMTLIRPTMTGDETFIRNFVLGNESLKLIIPDFKTEVFHNVDVSIGHSQLPQILRLAGYKYYRGWRPQGAMDSKGIPRQFNWIGNDGTSIICSRGTYAGFWQADYMDKKGFSKNDGSLIEFYNIEIKDILEHSVSEHIWIPFGMDDTRPMRDVKDSPVNLDKFMEYFNNETDAKMVYSKASTYFTGLKESELSIYKGILDPCDVGYNISSKGDRGLWFMRILLDRLLLTCETLCSMAVMEGSYYPENDLKELWNNLLLISSHGMEFVFANDYDDIYNLAVSSVSTLKTLIEKAKRNLVDSEPTSDNTGHVIFNTLNWERNNVISLPINNSPIDSFCISDSDGKILNHQILPAKSVVQEKQIHVLVEASIPPLGYTTVNIKLSESHQHKLAPPQKNSITPVEINTGITSVLFNCGAIKGVLGITKISGDDLYLNKICFTELEQTPKDAWLYNNKHGATFNMNPKEWYWEEFGPLRWKYVVTGTVSKHNFRQEIILRKNKSDIDFNLQLDCSGKDSGFYTAVFPADDKTEFMADIPFGIEKRDIINEPYGVVTDISIDNLERLWEGVFYAKSWVSYSVEDIDITLLGINCPRYYWYDPKNKNVSIILNRNYILDDCTDWMKDTHPWFENPGIISFSYSVDIKPLQKNKVYLPIIKKSKEKHNLPEVLQVVRDHMGIGKKLQKTYFDIISENSVISSLYYDKGKFIIRIYNASDSYDNAKIYSAKKILACKITDFHQNENRNNQSLSFKNDNCLQIKTAPWEITTFVLELQI